ncbi:acetate--CoA ligase [Salimicrobium halophilum]|uniref:acetate--CoA ligase n=1 Tax=Salimicrobium halophilum TaxID=86666 RepID=A0A1G8VSS8_9BACI|nr:acetate--CoA ligase [Salimicrobium halophilum]SDJ68907.1 acetyl-coenzyme A synthetase [Salimicrobium halophilum]
MAVLTPAEGSHNIDEEWKEGEPFHWERVHPEFTWYETGKVNMTYECVDRHVEQGRGEKKALWYFSEHEEQSWTYLDLQKEVNRWANVLKNHGVGKGDFVFVFLPKHPHCHVAMLAAVKIGAVVGPLFEAFMEEAVRDRIKDCDGEYLITSSEFLDRVPKKELPSLGTIFVTDDHVEGYVSITSEAKKEKEEAMTEWVDLNDGLNIHYTSGSTGKPKGIIHAHRVMIQQYQTGRWVLDLKEDDIYWCTAHPGWVTGTVYGVFAPLLNGVTTVIHGGRFSAEAWYDVIEKAGVSVWYSAPTAYRMLKSAGEDVRRRYDLTSLRHLLSVGEPLNPEVIYWAQEAFGLRVHDTWWMTETGAQLIANLPTRNIKPGSMGRPIPGVEAAVLDEEGQERPRGEVGHLAIRADWPAIMKEVWKNEEKYASYFPHGEEWYIAGDLAIMDEDGYVFFQGRSDDMINASGERIGPFEVESKLLEHEAVAEAGVVGKPDEVRGEIVKAFITLTPTYVANEELLEELRLFVKRRLAAHAAPKEIEVMEELPKTQISGKILRRKLKERDRVGG